jgi:hypothetical protein
MPKKYAEAVMMVLYTAFYLPLCPLGVVFTFCFVFFNFWVDKVSLEITNLSDSI